MRTRPSALGSALAALIAAATTWVAILAWRGFTEESQRFLVPLAVLGGLVAGIGAVLRWWRAPGVVVFLVQVVVTVLVAAAIISGSPMPVGEGWVSLRAAFEAAQLSANSFAPPVPAGAPGVHPFLIAGGLGCLLLVDLIACTLRRAPLAGLPLLTVYSVPVGMLGVDLVWWVFALSALGYLVLLFLEQGDRVRRWGRTLDAGASPLFGAGGSAGGATPSIVRLHGGAIGTGVTALAVILPLAIPTLSVQLFDVGRGSGGDDDISVTNPTTNLRRDLQQSRDRPLVRVSTDDPDPSYLRISVLTRFSDNEWSPGDRDIPSAQVADGRMPPLAGVSPTVTRESYDYRLEATDQFESTWLPTPEQTTSITAPGDWRYDVATTDFIASDDGLDTSGLEWTLSATKLALDANVMARAPSSVGQVSTKFTEVPDGINPYVRNLAIEVTRDAPSQYEKAVALQSWFRTSGGFTYSLEVDLKTGVDDLVRFLNPEDGGRTGYCQQFASSMALMARQLGIPARVAVGFLKPEQIGDDEWEFSSRDLHSWPEIFISGAGWVRFEPTPSVRAAAVPAYTEQAVAPTNPDLPNTPGGADPNDILPSDAASAAPATPEATPDVATTDEGSSTAWLPYVLAVLVLALLVLLTLSPGLIRRRRRDRRRDGDVEHVWVELRDTAIDLGLRWPATRSPRETGVALAAALGDAAPSPPLERIVVHLERRRYAASTEHDERAGLSDDLDAVLEAMQASVSGAARRRAAWLPRSVFRRGSGTPLPLSTEAATAEEGRSEQRLESV